jgi:hypothetical protein
VVTWLDVARAFADARGVGHYAHVLDAFVGPLPRGGPPAPAEMPWEADFEALERARLRDDLSVITVDLAQEVDEAQARMFERRVIAVDLALGDLGDDAGRLLRVGLRQRLRGILEAPRPRALRVRALADFYYSYAGLHHHRRRGVEAPSIGELSAGARWDAIAPGLEYALLEGASDDGPVHANLLKVDPAAVRLDVEDCRAHAAAGTSLQDLADARGAAAAMSGGFFLYSEPDIELPSRQHDPVGLLLRGGKVLSPPVFRRGALTVDELGVVNLERIGMADVRMQTPAGHPWSTSQTWNRATGARGPARPTAAIVGDAIVAVGTELPIPLNGFLVELVELPGAQTVAVGQTVRYDGVWGSRGTRLQTGIAGGPMLLRDGEPGLDMRAEDLWGSAPPVTFSQDETGDHNRLPRLAVGRRADGTLVFAAIDGRNFERALGMTLHETALVLRAQGCVEATNLDGGSSKRMVVDGRTRDLPTTEILSEHGASSPVRPVYTALLLYPRTPAPS